MAGAVRPEFGFTNLHFYPSSSSPYRDPGFYGERGGPGAGNLCANSNRYSYAGAAVRWTTSDVYPGDWRR